MNSEKIKKLSRLADKREFPLRNYTSDGLPISVQASVDHELQSLGRAGDTIGGTGLFGRYPNDLFPSHTATEQVGRYMKGANYDDEDVDDINSRVRRTLVTHDKVESRLADVQQELSEREQATGFKRVFGKSVVNRLEEEQFYLDRYQGEVLPDKEATEALARKIYDEYGDVLRTQAITMAESEGVIIKE